jgi:uncharacterized membrane protein YhaH (DUF805 family)
MDGNWYVRRGRIGRRTYWLQYALPITAASLIATWIDVSAGLAGFSTSFDYDTYSYSTHYTAGPFSIITSLVLLAPSISGLVARLHDRDHSAHWLWFVLLPIAGPVVLLITAGFLPGSPGPNAYGYPEGAVVPAPRKPSWKAPTSV